MGFLETLDPALLLRFDENFGKAKSNCPYCGSSRTVLSKIIVHKGPNSKYQDGWWCCECAQSFEETCTNCQNTTTVEWDQTRNRFYCRWCNKYYEFPKEKASLLEPEPYPLGRRLEI